MVNKNKILILLIILVVIGIVVFKSYRTVELKINGLILNGVITTAKEPALSNTVRFEYKFYYEGKEYVRNISIEISDSKKFVGKNFPILFSKKSKNSELLILPVQYKRFRIKFPDSLNWVKKHKIPIADP